MSPPPVPREESLQRLVFPDPVAFRYLQDDPSATVVKNEALLLGFELFLVEQWACSRTQPTYHIVTFTGLTKHKITVGVLEVPKDETIWSARLKGYLKAMSNSYARRKETALGTIVVTNLSTFPSSLTVISVPDGSLRNCREMFIVNENMKKLGCSGRAGLSLTNPSAATEAKFVQLYRTSDRISISEAVVDLVRLCQIALVMFTKLDSEVTDGLLCDITEKALSDWWTEIGMDYFTLEPSDGSLGPTTVAALLGLFLGARNRLSVYGGPVSKDAFDLKPIKRGIDYFQKSQKLERTRKLDHGTLARLHQVTSKAASNEGWAVPRAVKSTVAELSGKGGEMVLGMVGAREKSGISDVETLDLGKFIESLSGERCRWLWYGRPKKSQPMDLFGNTGAPEEELLPEPDSLSGPRNRKKELTAQSTNFDQSTLARPYLQANTSQYSLDASDQDHALRKAVFKSVSSRVSDARSGLGRFKDAVTMPSRKGHSTKHSKDYDSPPAEVAAHVQEAENSPRDRSSPSSQLVPLRSNDQTMATTITTDAESMPYRDRNTEDPPPDFGPSITTKSEINRGPETFNLGDAHQPTSEGDMEDETTSRELSARFIQVQSGLRPVASMQSLRLPDESYHGDPNLTALNMRSMSFSLVDGVLTTEHVEDPGTDGRFLDAQHATLHQISNLKHRKRQLAQVESAMTNVSGNIHDDVTYLHRLAQRAQSDLDDMKMVEGQRKSDSKDMQVMINRIAKDGRSSVAEDLKDAEILGAKLEYELSALVSKVEDVDDAVLDFERQVEDLELRTKEVQGSIPRRSVWSSFSILQR